jgi:arylsulfatase A
MFGDFLSVISAIRPVAAAGILSASLAAGAIAGTVETERPNVIVVLVDDLGYGDLGCYGQTKVKTPNLDRMAAEGMRFTDFYAGSTVCAPSRSSLLTGQHSGRGPVRDLSKFAEREKGNGEVALPATGPSLGRLMRGAGYTTACIGKWGMGSPASSGAPVRQGFDYFRGYIGHGEAHEYFPKTLWRNDSKEALPEGTYAPDDFAVETASFLEKNKDRPFFLYLTPTIPHFKLQIPSLGDYAGKDDWKQTSRTRAAMVARLDKDMGALLDKLTALGLREKTLVLFTSDNGPTGERGVELGFFDSTGGLRGQKRDLYEGGIRVPLLAWWPGTIPANSVTPQIAANWDILPTVAAVADLPAPEGLDGVSLLPVLEGKMASIPRGYLYWEIIQRGGKQAVRQDNWKAVRLGVSSDDNAPIELYDLAADPGETTNLAAQHPDIVQKMDELMKAAHTPSTLFPILATERAALGLAPSEVKKKDQPDTDE